MKVRFLLASLALFLSAIVYGQATTEVEVKGVVKDSKGVALPGITITEKNTTNVATTNAVGEFNIKLKSANSNLVLTGVGFQTQELRAEQGKLLSVVLTEDVKELSDVVVVGYGTQKKQSVTGAIQKLDGKELVNRPVSSTAALLQGKVAGLIVSQPSGGATPGSNPIIQIRGQALLNANTPPLTIIDGVPSSMNDFNNLNPNDIADISVLKDAAASAIYGARAPFGVVLVTTKVGNKNKKPVVEYNANFAKVEAINLPSMADSYSFILSKIEAYKNEGIPTHPSIVWFTPAKVDLIKDNIENPGKYTLNDLISPNGTTWGFGTTSAMNNNFFDVWFKDSYRQDHNISIRGGSNKTDYSFSAGYLYQPGILNFVSDFDNFQKFYVNGTLSSQMNNWLKISYRTRFTNTKAMAPALDFNEGRGRIYRFAYGAWPTTPIVNPDGTYNEGARIPAAMQSGEHTSIVNTFVNTLSLEAKAAKGLTFHVDANSQFVFNDYQEHRKPAYTGKPGSTDLNLIAGTQSSIYKSYSRSHYWTVQGYGAYEKNINKHYFKIQVGAQAEEQNFESLSAGALNLLDPTIPAIAVSTDEKPTVTDALSDWATLGTFGRFNYGFKDKYLLEVNARYDGSGRYGEGHRWGLFSGLSGGWVISKEAFWNSIKNIVNNAKLRASYGSLGNQGNTPGYVHIPTMAISRQSPWIFSGSRLPYVQTPGITNYDLTWEKITTLDFGFDAGFLKNRLTTSFDVFNRLSTDLIGPPNPLPSVLGTTVPAKNNTELVTKGWELQLAWNDQIGSNLYYGVQAQLADARSEIKKYNTSVNTLGSFYPGYELGEIWGYKATRLLQKEDFDANGVLLVSQSRINAKWYAGDVKYEDLNGDKLISPGSNTLEDHGDLVKIGNSTPRYTFSIAPSIGYDFNKVGRFDLYLFFQGVGKQQVMAPVNGYYYWGSRANDGGVFTEVSVYKGDNLDFYRDENSDPRLIALLGINKDAKFPRPYAQYGGAKNFQNSTLYLLEQSYIRLKNLQVSYTISENILKKTGISGCKIYFSAENLFRISNVPDYLDPELIQGRVYPQQSLKSLGINLAF